MYDFKLIYHQDWENVRLVDNGGFAKLNTTYPYYAHAEAQTKPDLQGRAYKAAWLTNAYTALLYNVTNPGNETTGRKAWQYLNSVVGKEFPIEVESYFHFDRLDINDNYASHLGFLTSSSQKLGTKDMPNPFQISGRNFSDTRKKSMSSLQNIPEKTLTNILRAYMSWRREQRYREYIKHSCGVWLHPWCSSSDRWWEFETLRCRE